MVILFVRQLDPMIFNQMYYNPEMSQTICRLLRLKIVILHTKILTARPNWTFDVVNRKRVGGGFYAGDLSDLCESVDLAYGL